MTEQKAGNNRGEIEARDEENGRCLIVRWGEQGGSRYEQQGQKEQKDAEEEEEEEKREKRIPVVVVSSEKA